MNDEKPKLDPTNPPIDSTGIKPDSYCTFSSPQMKTCNIIQDAGEYYIYDDSGKPGVVEKDNCRVVSIAVSVIR